MAEKMERDPDEQSVLETLVGLLGRPLTPEEENLTLVQARQIGNLG